MDYKGLLYVCVALHRGCSISPDGKHGIRLDNKVSERTGHERVCLLGLSLPKLELKGKKDSVLRTRREEKSPEELRWERKGKEGKEVSEKGHGRLEKHGEVWESSHVLWNLLMYTGSRSRLGMHITANKM